MIDDPSITSPSLTGSSLGRVPFSPRSWEVGELLAESWEITRPHLVGLNVVGSVAFLVWLGGIAVSQLLSMAPVYLLRESNPALGEGIGLALTFPLLLVETVLNAWIAVGLRRYTLAVVRGEAPSAQMVYSGGDRLWTQVFTSFLLTLFSLAGALCCGLPSIPIGLGLSLVGSLVADTELGTIQVLKASWAATDGHKFALFVYGIAISGLNLAGAIPLGLGLIVTWPLTVVSAALLYVRLTGRTFTGMGDPTVY